MTEEFKPHPLRTAKRFIYKLVTVGVTDTETPPFIGKYEPFDLWPIFFKGDTYEEVETRMDQWAEEQCAIYEKDYWKQREKYAIAVARMAKARAARGVSK